MGRQRWIALDMGGRIFGIRRHRITQNLELEVAWTDRWVEDFLVDFISVCQQPPKLTGEFLKDLKRYLSGISAASQVGSHRHPSGIPSRISAQRHLSGIPRRVSKPDLKRDLKVGSQAGFQGSQEDPSMDLEEDLKNGVSVGSRGDQPPAYLHRIIVGLAYLGRGRSKKEGNKDGRKEGHWHMFELFCLLLQQSFVWHFGITGRRRPGHLLRDIMGSDDTWGMIIAWIWVVAIRPFLLFFSLSLEGGRMGGGKYWGMGISLLCFAVGLAGLWD